MKNIYKLSQISQENAAGSNPAANKFLRENLLETFSELGQLDPTLREEVAIPTLKNFIISKECEPSLRLEILELLLSDKFITKDIEFGESNSSILRSATILTLVAVIIGIVKNEDTITKEAVGSLITVALTILVNEKDHRGYDPELGWIHIHAHLSDLLGSISWLSIDQDQKLIIVKEILNWLISSDCHSFKFGEDLRFGKCLALHLKKIYAEKLKPIFELDLYIDEAPYFNQNLASTLSACYFYLASDTSTDDQKLKMIEKIL